MKCFVSVILTIRKANASNLNRNAYVNVKHVRLSTQDNTGTVFLSGCSNKMYGRRHVQNFNWCKLPGRMTVTVLALITSKTDPVRQT